MSDVLLSVVIPTYNKSALLERTLDALADQDLGKAEWEIVVVDDGSTDGTAELLQRRMTLADGRLHPVHPGRNVGRAAARNLGARKARGQYLVFIDDDIIAPPGLLAAHLELLTNHPGCGTIGYAVSDPEVVDAPHFTYLDTRAVAKLAPGVAPARYFVTQNAAVPRQAFLTAGGFDEDFGGYGFEDMEVGFRLEDKEQVAFRALTRPVPTHVHHHTLAEYFAKKRECGASSLRLLARVHSHRLHEMRLDLVVDPPGAVAPLWIKLLRAALDGLPGRWIQKIVANWPTDSRHRPRLAGVYLRAMDVAVLACFRQGLQVESAES